MWLGMTPSENRAVREAKIDIRLHGWYYLGASSSPDLVKVVKQDDRRFWYQNVDDLRHNEGKPIQIETAIGHDLIAMAAATMRKTIDGWRKYTEVWQRDAVAQREYILDRHDLPEHMKQDIDLAQAESEVYTTSDSKGRQSTLEYQIEDALREQDTPERWLESRIQQIHRQGKAATVYALAGYEPIAFYPDGDYLWGEDRNDYPRDTQVYTPDIAPRPMVYTVYVYADAQRASVTDQWVLTADNYTRRFHDLEEAKAAGYAAVQPSGKFVILGTDYIIGHPQVSLDFNGAVRSDTTDWCAFTPDYHPGFLDYGRAWSDSGYSDIYYGGDFVSGGRAFNTGTHVYTANDPCA